MFSPNSSFQTLQAVCDPIVNKPKPKVEPPKDDKKPEEAAKTEGTNDEKMDMGGAEGAADATSQDQTTTNPTPEEDAGDMELD